MTQKSNSFVLSLYKVIFVRSDDLMLHDDKGRKIMKWVLAFFIWPFMLRKWINWKNGFNMNWQKFEKCLVQKISL